jgi:2-keto-4-pentenoate hydratase/2-oxohepta-3-ene-1,7-dioic acid hydratase in catechol pathway
VKLVTYRHDEQVSCGIVVSQGVVDIASIWKGADRPHSVLEILERGRDCLDRLRSSVESDPEVIPLQSVRLLAPLPRPGKLLALAGNYAEHVKEASQNRGFQVGLSDSPRQTTVPRPFLMPPTVVCGPGDTVPWPVYSEQIDYELELGVVIGEKAKCVRANEALDFVAGYTITNDVSARSVTFKEGRTKRPWDEFYDWLNGKWADGFLPMGPYLVTKDEISDVQNLHITLKVNGQTRQDANTAQMIYPVADVISFLSHLMTLEPGDIISTGTPAGVGLATGNFLKAGDVMEGTIEGLGTLANPLGPRPDHFYQPLVEQKTTQMG